MNVKFYVPFQTAQALKEKGYPQSDAEFYYSMFDSSVLGYIHERTKLESLYNEKFSIMLECLVAAPTYHEVVDWLEEKGITIEVKKHYITNNDDYGWKSYIQRSEYDREFVKFVMTTREEAINAAIIKALEKL